MVNLIENSSIGLNKTSSYFLLSLKQTKMCYLNLHFSFDLLKILSKNLRSNDNKLL